MANSYLLKGGTALLHDNDDNVTAVKTDILVRDSKISQIAPNITVSSAVEVLDCTDSIISPGFVNTHQHVWQTQLRGKRMCSDYHYIVF